ncbi:MAG: hypothetical protein AAF171_17650 [Cyanobacteria bacterium P01_A01_bin.116]
MTDNLSEIAERWENVPFHSTYKGLTATVERSLIDGSLQAVVNFPDKDDFLTFGGADAGELAANFVYAVDDYLEACAAEGIEVKMPDAVVV